MSEISQFAYLSLIEGQYRVTVMNLHDIVLLTRA